MESIIISPKTKGESKLLMDMLAKMKIASKLMSDEETEDMGLLKLMKDADRSKKVTREAVMKKLHA